MADDNTETANSWAAWGKPIVAAIVTSTLSYLLVTIFALTVSYSMNRSIYRSTSLRVLTGVFAGVTALVTFWVVLFSPKTHYFGLFPVLDATGGDPRGGWLNYFRSSYNSGDGDHRRIVEELVRSSLGWRREGDLMVNTSGAMSISAPLGAMWAGMPEVVNEERGRAARRIGHSGAWSEEFRGIGGVVREPREVVPAPEEEGEEAEA